MKTLSLVKVLRDICSPFKQQEAKVPFSVFGKQQRLQAFIKSQRVEASYAGDSMRDVSFKTGQGAFVSQLSQV